MQKIPAGTFIIPMLLSSLVYTFFPELFNIGGVTQAFLSKDGTSFIIGLLVFAAGTTVDLKSIGDLIKHQGALVLWNIFYSSLASLIYLYAFGQEGILGISGLGFVAVMMSINPAVHLSIIHDYGDNPEDAAIYPIAALPALPTFSLFILSFYESGSLGSIEWMPIISIFVPLIIGIVIGNLDKDLASFFGGMIGPLLPILGWILGQGMDLGEAAKSGLSGIFVTIIFIVINVPLMYLFDRYALKKNGLMGIGMANVAGMTTSVPAAVASAVPALQPYVTSALAQILMAVVITSVMTPWLVQVLAKKIERPKNGTPEHDVWLAEQANIIPED